MRIAKLSKFLLMCFFVCTLGQGLCAAQNSVEPKPSWRVRLADDHKSVVITVKATKVPSEYYLSKAVCQGEFLDPARHQLGNQNFLFPPPVEAGKQKEESFEQ